MVNQFSPSYCSNVAPRPLCEVSVFHLDILFMSKWLFSVMLLICFFNSSKPFVYRRSIGRLILFTKSGRSGELRVKRFGTHFIYWLIAAKNDLNSYIFFGFGRLFIESDFPTNSFTPRLISWIPATLFLFVKIHFSPILLPCSCCPRCLKFLFVSLCVRLKILFCY